MEASAVGLSEVALLQDEAREEPALLGLLGVDKGVTGLLTEHPAAREAGGGLDGLRGGRQGALADDLPAEQGLTDDLTPLHLGQDLVREGSRGAGRRMHAGDDGDQAEIDRRAANHRTWGSRPSKYAKQKKCA